MQQNDNLDPVVVVTGASSGIGRALLEKAVKCGFRVAGADRDAEAFGELSSLANEDRLLLKSVDVSSPEEVTEFAAAVSERFGRVDVVFNNAGIFASGRVTNVTPATWRRVMDVNVLGVVNVIQSFIPLMSANAARSRMVVTSSISSFVTNRSIGPYAASKYAVLAIAQTLDQELRKDAPQVHVSLFVPGPVQTNLIAKSDLENSAEVVSALEGAMVERGSTPAQVADWIFEHLESDEFIWAMNADVVRQTLIKSIDRLMGA